jgi:hypothetical protein
MTVIAGEFKPVFHKYKRKGKKNINCEVSFQAFVTWNKPTILNVHTNKNADKN